MKRLLILLFLVSVLFAQQADTGMDRTISTLDDLLAEGQDWATTGKAAGDSVFGVIYQTENCTDPFAAQSGTGIWAVDTFRMSGIIVLIIVFAIVVMYLVGVVLQSDNIILMAKDQVFPLLHALILVAALMGSVMASTMWNEAKIQGQVDPECHIYDSAQQRGEQLSFIDIGMSFSRCMTFKMISDYSFLLLYNTVVHTLYSSTMWIGVTWRAMYSFNMGPMLKPLIDLLGTTLQFLSLAIGEWILHAVTLCIIKKWTWGLFIPIGIILRVIPPTRDAGSAILALMFAFQLVYPMMFTLDYEVYRVTSKPLLDNESIVKSFFDESGLLGVGAVFLVSAFLVAGVLMPFFVTWAITVAFELVRNAIYYVVIIGLLLPFINIFVTLTAAKEIAKTFGAQVNFMSFLRLI